MSRSTEPRQNFEPEPEICWNTSRPEVPIHPLGRIAEARNRTRPEQDSMSSDTSNKIARPGFLLLLAALATGLLVLIIAPFAASLFAAAVLAGVLHPAQVRLADTLGDRPTVAAGLVTVGISAIAIAPLAVLCVFVTRQLTALYAEAASTLENEGVDGLVDSFPAPLGDWARRGLELIGVGPHGGSAAAANDSSAQSIPEGTIETAANVAADLASGLFGVLLDLGVMVVALFFLLSQGAKLVEWITDALPLSKDESSRLVGEFRDVTRAVFTATVATAFIQTIIAATGYWIAGVPYLPIALLVTFVCALIPVVGAALVAIVIGAFLVLSGDTGYGVFLIAWGVLPVGLSDNLVKPWMAQGQIKLPGSVVLFAMLGGVTVFGPLGVVAGPLVISLFLASLRLLREEDILPSR